jgi:hypothetical protein
LYLMKGFRCNNEAGDVHRRATLQPRIRCIGLMTQGQERVYYYDQTRPSLSTFTTLSEPG